MMASPVRLLPGRARLAAMPRATGSITVAMMMGTTLVARLRVRIASLPDVLVTAGSEAILTLKRATSVVPIIMATVIDPVALGIAASLARPGSNLTGLAIMSVELTSKRLQLLKEAVPRLSRVAVLWNPDNPGNVLQLKEVGTASQILGLRWRGAAVRRPDELAGAFEAIVRAQSTGILAIEDSMLVSYRSRIVESVARARLPAIYAF